MQAAAPAAVAHDRIWFVAISSQPGHGSPILVGHKQDLTDLPCPVPRPVATAVISAFDAGPLDSSKLPAMVILVKEYYLMTVLC